MSNANNLSASERTTLLLSDNHGGHGRRTPSPEPDHTQQVNALPRKSLLYKAFMLISAFASFVSGLMLLTQGMTFVILSSNWIQVILRVYVITFCVMFILAELQVQYFLKHVQAFKNWFHRGFLYSFMGVISMEESVASLGQQFPELPGFMEYMVSLLLRICSIAMFAIGVLYMLMGVLCLRGVWETMQERHNIQMQRTIATIVV